MLQDEKWNNQKKVKQNLPVSRILIVAVLLIVLFFLVSFMTDKKHPTGKFFNGTITGVSQPDINARETETKVLVTLDDGTIVKVTPADMGAWQRGKRITVEEMSSMRFRIKTYRFVKHITNNRK